MEHRIAVIVVAAGRGTRLQSAAHKVPKQYLNIGGKPILLHTIKAFLSHPAVAEVLCVIHPENRGDYDACVEDGSSALKDKLLLPVTGGPTRQASVLNGLRALKTSGGPDFVLIHDAARPFVTHSAIDRMLEELSSGTKAALAAVPVVDTLKKSDADQVVARTIDRTGMWAAQTPQGFAFDEILDAHEQVAANGLHDFTDDAAIAEWAGFGVKITLGETGNFKITTQDDLERAQHIMSEKAVPLLTDIRVGSGYDVHAFAEGDGVILGGVTLPHDKRLSGHSDADVVLHALTDAILGAIAEADIGAHFPPSDEKWKGASSDQFLVHALGLVKAKGGKVAHLDATVICERPKVGPYRDAIRKSIAAICGLPIDRVSVKATTSERLGFTGRQEGIAAMATATVRLPESWESSS